MAEAIVSDWLAEYNSLEPQEIRTFAALHAENHELSTAIHSILNDKTKHSEVSTWGSKVELNKMINCLLCKQEWAEIIKKIISWL